MNKSTADLQLFERWLERHGAILHRVSRAFAHLEQGDLHQEMLLQLWRSLPNFRGQAKESTWIYRVAFNTALTWNRQDRQRREVHLEDEPAAPGPSAAPRLDELYAAVRTLKPLDRTLIVLFLDDYSYQEMSEITGISLSNVGVRLKRCKEKLFQEMKGDPS